MPIQKRWPKAFDHNGMDRDRFEKIQPNIHFGWIWSEYNLTFCHSNVDENFYNFISYDLAFDRWNWNVTIDDSLKNISENKDLVFVSNLSSKRKHLWLIRNHYNNRQLLLALYDNLTHWYFLCSADLYDDGRRIDNVTFSNNSCDNEALAPMMLDNQPIIKAFQTHARLFFLTNRYVYVVSSLLLRRKSRTFGLSFRMVRKNLDELLICEPSILQLINDNRMYYFTH